MIRVFAALLPSAAAREHLVHTLRPIHAATTNELRWTDPDNWHLTMAF
ncbi:MAG: RNA 2',3'-cyclic phosphodiesterase, partial [Corynebacterium sp.]|nr:RNA 2',3'-cyclic phosphodiesterase [Corynebacterium sp.]